VAPFGARAVRTVAVSPDGGAVLITSGGSAWWLDPRTMRVRARATLPHAATATALSRDGERAVLCADDALYVWDVATCEPVVVARSNGLDDTELLAISADGRIAVAARRAESAIVRVFDLAARGLVYSLRADCARGLALHPGGGQLVCFGDNDAVVYDRAGKTDTVLRVSGGCFSPDGQALVTNSFERTTILLVHAVGPTTGEIRTPAKVECEVQIERWNPSITMSPRGTHVLVRAADAIARVDLASGAAISFGERATYGGIASDGRAFIGPVDGTPIVPRIDAIKVVVGDTGRSLGCLVEARGAASNHLVGAVQPGLYGSLAAPAGPIGAELAARYERPDVVPGMLGAEDGAPLAAEDQVAIDELAERYAAWDEWRPQLTADLAPRELVMINRGLLHLTPEIVHAALAIARDAPRFGNPQLALHALETASGKLAALSASERDRVFTEMLARLDGPPEPPQPPPPPPPRWMLAIDEALGDDE
jgi:hypothetical protein